MSNRFRPWEHIRRGEDFRRAFDRKRSASDQWVIVYVCENALPHSRLGLSVSRKTGTAVVRNRFRRRCREAYRLVKSDLPPGVDVVVIPRGSELPSVADLMASFRTLVPQAAQRLTREVKPS